MNCREAAWNIDTIVKCFMTASLLLLASNLAARSMNSK